MRVVRFLPVLVLLGLTGNAFGQVVAPTTAEIGSAITDVFFPVIAPLIGIAASIMVIFFAWNSIKRMFSVGRKRV